MNLDIDELKFSKIAEDKDFEYPINIRQVGTIHKGVKIYIEDYAYTYLYQYAESGGSQEKIAVLVGRALIHNDEIIVLISGAIGGKYSKEINSMECFTDEDWENIDSQMKKHFAGLQILGWMHSQPGYGTFLNSNDTN